MSNNKSYNSELTEMADMPNYISQDSMSTVLSLVSRQLSAFKLPKVPIEK